jgi:uncharacterized protein (DUF2147 family)
MKTIYSFFFFLLSMQPLVAIEDIRGFWKTVNEEGVAQCIIAVYEYEGVRYGRIIATYGDNGTIDDSIYHPKKRAPGVIGTPFYSGLDIIWDLMPSSMVFKGKILDPEHGKVYKAELWRDAADLVVRGKLMMFGRSQTWYPVEPSDLPPSFKLPDLDSFVPAIPKVP